MATINCTTIALTFETVPVFTATTTQTLGALTQAVTVQADYTTAQVTQTLPAVTQASTGETIYFTVHDTVTLSDVLTTRIHELFEDAVLVGDVNYVTLIQQMADTVNFTDEVTYFFSNSLQSTVTTVDGFGSITQTTLLTPKNGAVAKDRVTISVTAVLTSSINVTDDSELSTKAVFADTVTVIGGPPTNTLVATQLVQATLTASDALYPSLSGELTDTVDIVDSLVIYNSENLAINDTVVVSDTVINTLSTTETLTSSVVLETTVLLTGSVYNSTLSDTVLITGYLGAKDFETRAWLLNTETGGLATYDNFQFNSLAAYNGVLYGTSTSGLYALTGDTDEGRKVNSTLKYGFLDFGTNKTKRISDVFVGYTGGQLEFDVETYDSGNEVYTYPMEEREAQAPRNNRIKPGRGLSSRYWRFTVRNTEGADFQLQDVAVEVAASKRRL